MGWLFSYNIRSKREMVAHLRRPERFGQHHELLRTTTVGNNHWYLCRNLLTGLVFIGLDKVAGGIKEGWGYKDMDESVGPSEVDCPLSYLSQASRATGYAIEWRAKVRVFMRRNWLGQTTRRVRWWSMAKPDTHWCDQQGRGAAGMYREHQTGCIFGCR